MDTRVCVSCHIEKPLTSEFFYARSGRPNQFYTECIECKRLRYKRPPRPERLPVTSKACRICKVEKPLAQLVKDKRSFCGVKALCLDCAREQHRANRQQPQQIEKNRQRARAWKKANPDRRRENSRRWRLLNPEKNKEAVRRSKKRHPETLRRANQRNSATRRARLLNAAGSIKPADIQAQYKRQKGRCYYCGVAVGNTYHVDHVIPLSRGGDNSPSNIVIACPKCNAEKNDRLPHEWPKGGRLL